MLAALKTLRKRLHQYPELSGQEGQTAHRIKDFLKDYPPTHLLEYLGGTGLAAIYTFGSSGPTILIRCELDALPIEEPNTFSHQSKNKGVSHKCGHDGHMAMVAGLAAWLQKQTFQTGKVILLFQPAEETGKGAALVLQDERFALLQPDYLFALHNLPGEPLHTIITKNHSFSASVQSMAIQFKGKEAHASEPENGINPALAIAQLIPQINALSNPDVHSQNFGLITLVHSKIGTKAYGIAPGLGELHYTIRAWTDEQRLQLEKKITTLIQTISEQHQLTYSIDYLEYFPATQNHPRCSELIQRVAQEQGFTIKERTIPLKFGEDFGWFSKQYKAAMFGLGAGVDTPALHHATYDFPDELIETGIRMFGGLITLILNRRFR